MNGAVLFQSTKGKLREVKRGSVQGNECILEVKKFLVEEMGWKETDNAEKRGFFKKRDQAMET